MRLKRILLLGVGSFLLLAFYSCAPKVDIEAEKAKITELINESGRALENQDWDKMKEICSEDVEHYSHLGIAWTLQDMREFFETHITEHKITFSNIRVRVSRDGSMAWAKFNEHTEYLFDGHPMKENAIFTAVFEKRDGEWKLVQFQRSAPPPQAQPDIS